MTAPITLAIDACTYTGTAALLRGGELLAECETAMRGEQEERLMPAVAALITNAGLGPADVTRVICGGGPGSFTSLRIAAAIAKGIASARRIPFVPVPSLALIVTGNDLPDGRYLALLDAMRGDVFAAAYAVSAGEITEIAPMAVLSRNAAARAAAELGVRAVGPAETPALWPKARGVLRMAAWLGRAPAADLATWEPDYGRQAEAQAVWERTHGRPLEGA